MYTPGGNANMVKVDVPNALPSFTQNPQFTAGPSSPLTFETGGYNAFTANVDEITPPMRVSPARIALPSPRRIAAWIRSPARKATSAWNSGTPCRCRRSWDYHPFTFNASTRTPPWVYFIDVDFWNRDTILVQINNTVMSAQTTPPVLSSGWRHFALTYEQPYVMMFTGAGYEVKQGTNYDFGREFTIVLNFSASDVSTEQGLLYKGTGSDTASPQLNMSYSVAIEDSAVSLAITDGALNYCKFTGPSVLQKNQFYQVGHRETDRHHRGQLQRTGALWSSVRSRRDRVRAQQGR